MTGAPPLRQPRWPRRNRRSLSTNSPYGNPGQTSCPTWHCRSGAGSGRRRIHGPVPASVGREDTSGPSPDPARGRPSRVAGVRGRAGSGRRHHLGHHRGSQYASPCRYAPVVGRRGPGCRWGSPARRVVLAQRFRPARCPGGAVGVTGLARRQPDLRARDARADGVGGPRWHGRRRLPAVLLQRSVPDRRRRRHRYLDEHAADLRRTLRRRMVAATGHPAGSSSRPP